MTEERPRGRAPDAASGGPSASLPALGVDQQRALERLAQLIVGSPHNLVAARDRPVLRQIHIEECVRVGAALDLQPGSRWMDLGTGGGLPGLVLAVTAPEVLWTLVDATGKKVREVASFAERLGLRNVEAVQARAEDLAHRVEHRGRYDGVISRALAPLPTVLELARGFLRPGGTLAAVKGPRAEREIQQAERARRALALGDVHTLTISGVARPTVLVTMPALGPPPASFPRRVGVPATEPLGGESG